MSCDIQLKKHIYAWGNAKNKEMHLFFLEAHRISVRLKNRTTNKYIEKKKQQHEMWKKPKVLGKPKSNKKSANLSELLNSGTRKGIPRKYKQMLIPEALESAKRRHWALAAKLKRYTKDTEARRTNRLFSTEPTKVYSQRQRA